MLPIRHVVFSKCKGKVKVLPYWLPSAGPGANPDVQAVSHQVTWSHPPAGRLPLLSTRPAVTFPAEERHRPSAGTKLYCLVTEARACEQLAQDCYLEVDRPSFEPATFWIASECSTIMPHRLKVKSKLSWKQEFTIEKNCSLGLSLKLALLVQWGQFCWVWQSSYHKWSHQWRDTPPFVSECPSLCRQLATLSLWSVHLS